MFFERNNKKHSTIKSLSLKKNFSWTLIGNVIYACCQWGMLIVLAKLGSAEMVGIFSLALAITAPVLMLTNLQLRSVQATDTRELYQFGDYLGLRLILSICAFIIVCTIVFIANYSLEIVLVVLIICIAKIIESISDIGFGLMQKNESMDRIAISMIFKGVLSLLIFSLAVSITNSLVIGAIALALAWLIVLVFYDIKNINYFAKFRPKINITIIVSLIKLSLPLGIVMMMTSLNTNLPRYFLEFYINEEALGYFAAMAYLIIAGNTVISALGQSATPRLAKYYASGKWKNFRDLILKLVGLGFLIGVLGISISLLLGEELLTLIYRDEYADNIDVFILIMVAGAINFVGSFLGYGITATRSFKIQPIVGLFGVLSALFGSILFIPSYALLGAAYVLILSASVQLVIKIFVLVYLIYIKKVEDYEM